MYVSNILYPFTYGLHLGYLHLLAMANNPAIYMQLCNYLFQILFSTLLGTHTRSGPAVSHGNSIFNTLRNCHTDLESVAQLHSSIESTQGFCSPRRLHNTCRVLLGLKICLFVFLLVEVCVFVHTGKGHTFLGPRTIMLQSQFPPNPVDFRDCVGVGRHYLPIFSLRHYLLKAPELPQNSVGNPDWFMERISFNIRRPNFYHHVLRTMKD